MGPGLIASVDDLKSLEYLSIPEQVTEVLGADYPYDIDLSKMSGLHPLKNLKNLISPDMFDFGDLENFDRYFHPWNKVDPVEKERKREMLKKAIEGFPNLVPLKEKDIYDLQIAKIDSSTFFDVNIFPSLSEE